MNGQRLKGLLGLALRAGQATFGADVCGRLLKGGQAAVLLLDGEAGGNTRKKFRDACGRTGTAFAVLPEGMITEATGKTNTVMALKKGSIADQVAGCLQEADGE